MLDVTIYSADSEGEGWEVSNVDLVSLVNNSTYGPPALIAAKDGQRPVGPGNRVLYINTSLVPVFEIERRG
jgi:hypothetical protein